MDSVSSMWTTVLEAATGLMVGILGLVLAGPVGGVAGVFGTWLVIRTSERLRALEESVNLLARENDRLRERIDELEDTSR